MKILPLALAATLLAVPAAAPAALSVGAKAPDFTTQGALAGKAFKLHLAEALKKGPVVLYFFPKVFTPGCTIEAHAFAEATEDFKKAGATVIGMSADDIEGLKKFSKEECRDKFAVASATPAIIKGFDVALAERPGMTNRTSYVIAQSGRIAYSYTEMNPNAHVKNTLAQVQALQKAK